MEFLKAFLLYLAFVVLFGILFFIIIYAIYAISISLHALKRKFQKITPNYKFPLRPAAKKIKIAVALYFGVCAVFYAVKAGDYLIGDRPYKEAKAYAIAGDYLSLWQLLFGNYRTVDTFFYQGLQSIQRKFVLNPIYRLIPESDAERDIWRYRFQQYVYARSFWAPVTQEDKKKGILYNWPNASYKPELLTILLDIYDSIIRLDTLPMQDKEFDRIYRYLTMANMFQYYWMYNEQQVNLRYENTKDGYRDKSGKNYIFHNTPFYKEQHARYIKAIDDVKEAIEKDNVLAKVFESKPHAKAALYWVGVDEYRRIVYRAIYDGVYPCETYAINRFAKYYNEYLNWSQNPRSSFASFSKHRKKQYAFMIEGGVESIHYTAKYICGMQFQHFSRGERRFLANGNKKEDLKGLVVTMLFDNFRQAIKELEYNQTARQGDYDGR